MTIDTRGNIRTQLRDPKTGRVIANRPTPTVAITAALDNALRSIRARHLDLPPIVLTIGDGRFGRSMAHGVFMPERWTDTKTKATRTHELKLAGESFARGAEATLGTLLHECAHALASARGIQDTSRQGRFHNKRFKALAEEVGIQVEQVEGIGWSQTTLPKETAKIYAAELSELRKALKTYRVAEYDVEKPPRVSHMVKLECECRTLRVPIAFLDAGDITCNVCGMVFVKSEG